MGQTLLPTGVAANLMLLVRLGSSLHAIPVDAIEEVLPNLPLEPVPQSPPHIKGVVFVRGHLIPVLDARRRLGMPEGNRADDPHIVCIRSGGRLVGVEVDEAIDLIDIAPASIMSGEQLGGGECLTGLVERDGVVIRVLNTARLVER